MSLTSLGLSTTLPRMKCPRAWSLPLVLLTLACPTPPPDRPVDSGELEPETGPDGSIIRRYDLDGDGKANIWRVYQGDVLTRVDMDLNSDGKADTRRFVDAGGDMVKEEADLDFDGRIDIVATFSGGQKVQEAAFLQHRAVPDVLRLFVDGKIAEKRRDVDGDGVYELFEYFDAGRLVRLGRDTTGDGQPDEFDERPDADAIPDEERG